jgi:hypothetical protein
MPQQNKPLVVSRRAVEMIIMEEIGSIEYYNKVCCRPTWPGGDSGVTIGIGYDLGYNNRAQIIADWRGKIPEDKLQVLLACSGFKGSEAKEKCSTAIIRSINVPYQNAFEVFVKRTVPRFAKDTITAFPNVTQLHPDAQGALLSLVFNRGSRLNDVGAKENKEHARQEMRTIAEACTKADYSTIAASLISMKRLWDGVPDFSGDNEPKLGGVLRRRDKEAELVKGAERTYTTDELLTIQ